MIHRQLCAFCAHPTFLKWKLSPWWYVIINSATICWEPQMEKNYLWIVLCILISIGTIFRYCTLKVLHKKYFVLDKLLETDAPDIKHFITSIAHHCEGGQFKIKGKEDKMFNSFCQITYCINLRQSKTIVFYCFYISIT